MWITKKTGCRDYTNELIERAEEGVLDWENIARAALQYMSEDDVKDMAECNDFIEDDEDEDEENWEDEDPECDGDDTEIGD